MNKLQLNFNRNSNIFIQENAFESVVCEMAAMLSRPQYVNLTSLVNTLQLRLKQLWSGLISDGNILVPGQSGLNIYRVKFQFSYLQYESLFAYR